MLRLAADCRLLPGEFLRAPPEVHRGDAVDAADGAVRRAPLRRDELAADVVGRVGLERHARCAALLRAVVDEALFADVEIPRARAAPPFVRLAVHELRLEVRDARVQV